MMNRAAPLPRRRRTAVAIELRPEPAMPSAALTLLVAISAACLILL